MSSFLEAIARAMVLILKRNVPLTEQFRLGENISSLKIKLKASHYILMVFSAVQNILENKFFPTHVKKVIRHWAVNLNALKFSFQNLAR